MCIGFMDTIYTITLTLSESFIYNLNNKVFHLISHNLKVFNKKRGAGFHISVYQSLNRYALVFDKQPDCMYILPAAAIFKYK